MPERPNFTEDSVALAIEHYLTLLSFPFHHFSIELISRKKERWLGADARLIGNSIKFFKPFYMQFKRPLAYPYSSRSPIVKERRYLDLETFPRVLVFKLRRKKRNQRELQHNLLYRLRQILQRLNLGDAAYVCPLFLDRRIYITSMHWGGLKNWLRYWWHVWWKGIPPQEWIYDILINEVRRRNSLELLIEGVPALYEHVVIPPHMRVQHADHAYSFTEDGTDICFHSPESLPETGQRLSEWLTKLSIGVAEPSRDFGYISAEASGSILREIIDEFSDVDDFVAERGDISDWFTWGSVLEEQYGILQFAFIIWK